MIYRELDLNQIKAKGWIHNYLSHQINGLTGNLNRVGEPFSGKYWDNPKGQKQNFSDEYFLGAMNVNDDAWVPFEQTGYWIDGMVRAGFLNNDEKLIQRAKDVIYQVIDNPDEDGYLGPDFLKNGLTWSHAVFFRSLIALYTATKDEKILNALKKHFLRRPLADVYETYKGFRMISVRNVADIEIALWIYGQTNEIEFLEMAEKSYEVFNSIYSNDEGVQKDSQMRDVTIKGMLSNRTVNRNHGVTYCEICKLAAILHLYTQKEIYKKAAVNAFDKLYRDQMIVDGVFSSTEYLNGNKDSHAMHETCNVSDFTWACGYLFMITGDAKYGDWIENAIFNAGLGCVDDDFKGHQYFSCPNQVISNDTSNHAFFYRGSDWHTYYPKNCLGCCAGNVNRFMPNFVIRSFYKSDLNDLVVLTYAPSQITLVKNEVEVIVDQKTNYPFENKIEFNFSCEKEVNLSLKFRIPDWAEQSFVSINGAKQTIQAKDGFYILERLFAPNDVVVLEFVDKVRFVENAHGVSVFKGALLFALPVKEREVNEGLRQGNDPEYPRYSLYPDSKWNYGVNLENFGVKVNQLDKISNTPWKSGNQNVSIDLTVKEIKNWKLKKVKNGLRRWNARGNVHPIGFECVFTPKVPKKVNEKYVGEQDIVTLVPYCSTRLRIAILPKI